MISTLIYSSICSTPLNDPEFSARINNIRFASEARNRRDGITGFLFYFDNRFVQIIEGDFEPVTGLFANIRRDCRHSAPRIVWFSENEKRAFDTWSMDCSMAYVSNSQTGIGVKLSFLTRFISDTSQQHIKLRDLLVDVAAALMARPEYPRPQLTVAA